jgi:aminopeptidase N
MVALPRDASPRAIRRLDYRPPAFLVDTIELTFALDPAATRVSATLAFRRNPAAHADDRNAALVLDGEDQRDVAVLLDRVPLASDRYALTASSLTVDDPPESGTLTISATISPVANTALEGLYISSGALCTQCEPEGFRRIAYFPDRPDVLTSYTVTLIADKSRYPVLLSNGNRVATGDLDGSRHYATWQDPFPKPTYLFALVAGDLDALTDTFVTRSGRTVALAIYSTSSNIPRCQHAMASLKRAMRWDEQRFGLEYDLDTFMIFCADDFNLGAMENKGLNIFNSKLVLADAATATDDDFQAIEGVIGHEYFHNWTGNRVTCRDWFQLSLKEGLTVFRDQEFSADMGSRAVERIGEVRFLRSRQFAEDAGPMAHPVRPDDYVEINNFYTSTVYEKGAEVIRMLHTLLGEERFRRGLDLYFARHDGQAVTCDDFVHAMEDASRAAGGPDLALFRRWYEQAGTPVVRARGRHDAAAKTYTLDVEQQTPPTPGQPGKAALDIPFAVALIGPDGRDLPLALEGESITATTRVLELRQSAQTFTFVGVDVCPVPSLLRGFCAPVKLEFDYDDDALALLAAHDSDSVNRWDAAQRSYVRAIIEQAERYARGAPLELCPPLVRIASALLADRTTDPALIAMALAAPDLEYLGECVTTIDVDALVAARRFVVQALAREVAPSLAAVRNAARVREPYALTQAQIGRRMLANVALRLLGAIDDAHARAAAIDQYDTADNMTDAIAALAALNDSDGVERAQLFARFEAKWQHEPLVLDKWFMLQALSQRADTLTRVRSLTVHPRFNARNPNRVRSLVGAFALRNWNGFHGADGSGYAFVVEQTLALDRVNPHLAAALAGAFNLWHRFTPRLRDAQRTALQRIAAAPHLSPDVGEVVTKALGA